MVREGIANAFEAVFVVAGISGDVWVSFQFSV
jgi:hypothetical protein